MAGLGWLVFCSIAGWLAQTGLCSVLLNDGGWPSQALLVLAVIVIMNGWPILVFSSIVGRMA